MDWRHNHSPTGAARLGVVCLDFSCFVTLLLTHISGIPLLEKRPTINGAGRKIMKLTKGHAGIDSQVVTYNLWFLNSLRFLDDTICC